MSGGTAVAAAVAERVVALRPGRRARVAVDGGSCTGKTTFADALAALVAPRPPVVRTSVDRFHRPRAERYRRGPASPVGCYEDTYDHAWDLVVLLVASQPEVLRRAVTRDAAHLGGPRAVVERYRARYLPAEALYARQCDPRGRADVVVDDEDPCSPLLLRG